MNNEKELKAHLQDRNKARIYAEKKNRHNVLIAKMYEDKKQDNLKKYRVFKEFFVEAHDEYEAETKSEDKKIKLPYNLIDVHEIDEDDEFYKEANNEHKKKEDEMIKNWKDEIAINKGGK